MALLPPCIRLGAMRAWSLRGFSSGSFAFKEEEEEEQFLESLQRLLHDLRQTSRPTDKVQIIRRQEGLCDFLRFYAHSGPFNITSHSLAKSVPLDDPSCPPENHHLQGLLEALSERRVTGHKAIAQVQRYVRTHPKYEALIRALLDRDWKAGTGPALLSKALHPVEHAEEAVGLVASDPPGARHIITAPHQHSSSRVRRPFPTTSKNLPIALGFPLQKVKLPSATDGDFWLISRKLDGIRCLAHYQRGVVKMITRAGNEINNLSKVRDELQALADKIASHHPEMTDFYIDGELCVARSRDGGDFSVDDLMDDLVDDFRSTLSTLLSKTDSSKGRSGQHSMVFFAFDLIDQQNLADTILSARLSRLRAGLEECGRPPPETIRLLTQHRTQNPLDFRLFVDQQRQHRWEGLILRRDAPFVPRRSRDIIKIKDFYEAEFAILDWRMEKMAVIVEGRHRVEELLSAVKIKFDGATEVWVGSGFSLEERRMFAQEPQRLKGAIATVRYFQESSSSKREAPLRSLRFPTIKAIYEEGKRPA